MSEHLRPIATVDIVLFTLALTRLLKLSMPLTLLLAGVVFKPFASKQRIQRQAE